MKKLPWFIAILTIITFRTWVAQFTFQQILAVSIFSCFILGTLFYWKFRLAFALIGVTCLLAAHLIDVPSLIEFANVDIILFLIAMMIVIGFLEERKFFEVLMEKLLTVVSHRVTLLFPLLMFTVL